MKYKVSDRKFINPYTFIPISDKKPDRGPDEEGDLSGYIECGISIKSPVFIPNTTRTYTEKVKTLCKDGTTKEMMHNSNVFYSYEDLSEEEKRNPEVPVIPGSELRGMIRNIYEQLTNSCYLHVDESNLPYKRSPEPKKPCIMVYDDKNGQWLLYKEPKYKEDYYKVERGELYGAKKGGRYNNSEFYVHLTGKIQNGRRGFNKQIIYRSMDHGKYMVIDDETMQRFYNVIDSYCDEKVNKNSNLRDIYENYKNNILEHKIPIFVYADETYKYLSPACITKEFFVNTIKDILVHNHEHNKCEDPEYICQACRMFGMVGEKGSAAGKLRFTDTYDAKGIEFLKELTIPILGSPRISATEFYLKNPPELEYNENNQDWNGTWNYDYYTTYRQYSIQERHYEYPTLLGRKVYWHGNFQTTTQKTNMNCSISPIKSKDGYKDDNFKFKVYFENLTRQQLSILYSALELNGEGIHKIGRGKPIGMGDIKISVNGIYKRVYSFENNKVKAEFEEYSMIEKLDAETMKYVLAYTKPLTEREEELVTYPVNVESDRIFEWFSANRGSISSPKIKQKLPDILEKDKSLFRYEKEKNVGNRNNYLNKHKNWHK